MKYISLAVKEYGSGRITLVTDRISGRKSYYGANRISFWRKLIQWTSSKNDQDKLNILLLDFHNYRPYYVLSNLLNVNVVSFSLNDVSIKDIEQFDTIYVSGLPESIDPDCLNKIHEFVDNGGGLFIENPNREDENINILEGIDEVYCSSINKPIQSQSYWSRRGKLHPVYDPLAKISFNSSIKFNDLGDGWDVLMSDRMFVSSDSDISLDDLIADSSGGAEFSISYISSLQKSIIDLNSISKNINNIAFTGNKVYAANKYDRIYGVFVSTIIESSDKIAKWNNISWDGSVDSNSKIYFYVRHSSDRYKIHDSKWEYYSVDGELDISSIQSKYLQIMVVMRIDNDDFSIPVVNSINLSYFTYENAAKFFTKTFNLNFKPKHVLLTYNAPTSENDILRFAVAGENTIDPSKYQYILPNKIEKLDDISKTSRNIKVMVEMISSSSVDVVLNEFALMFSGDEYARLNKLSMPGIGQAIIETDFIVQ